MNSMLIPHDERRGSFRITADRSLRESSWCESKEGLLSRLFAKRSPAQITDVSDGGVTFLASTEISMGTIVSIEVAYRDYRPFMMKGRVRRTSIIRDHAIETPESYMHQPHEPENAKEDLASIDKYFLIHIQFQHCDPASMDEYKRMIKRLNKIHNEQVS